MNERKTLTLTGLTTTITLLVGALVVYIGFPKEVDLPMNWAVTIFALSFLFYLILQGKTPWIMRAGMIATIVFLMAVALLSTVGVLVEAIATITILIVLAVMWYVEYRHS